jgi:hypothetical protein
MDFITLIISVTVNDIGVYIKKSMSAYASVSVK